ncbi:hypothetical protein NQZ68_003178 [Dissostichus eleginoides]|nr:hypothetical protein NQZ68_003178 [Dissostichus eleginoides]
MGVEGEAAYGVSPGEKGGVMCQLQAVGTWEEKRGLRMEGNRSRGRDRETDRRSIREKDRQTEPQRHPSSKGQGSGDSSKQFVQREELTALRAETEWQLSKKYRQEEAISQGQDFVRQLPSTSEADQEQMDGVMTPPAGGSSGATATQNPSMWMVLCTVDKRRLQTALMPLPFSSPSSLALSPPPPPRSGFSLSVSAEGEEEEGCSDQWQETRRWEGKTWISYQAVGRAEREAVCLLAFLIPASHVSASLQSQSTIINRSQNKKQTDDAVRTESGQNASSLSGQASNPTPEYRVSVMLVYTGPMSGTGEVRIL